MENHDEINMFLLISNTLMSLITITSIIYGLGGKENNGVLNKMCKLYVIDCVFLMIAVTLSSLMSYLLDNEFSLLFSYLFSLLLIYEIFHYYFSLLIEYKEKKEEEEEKYKQKNK
jgi:hypothetical protein